MSSRTHHRRKFILRSEKKPGVNPDPFLQLVVGLNVSGDCSSFDAGLDLEAKSSRLVVVAPRASLDVGLDLQATRDGLVMVSPSSGFDATLDLQTTVSFRRAVWACL
jgi:hypothetical protein